MNELYDIVDGESYIDNNCYQHQISVILASTFNVNRITLDALKNATLPAGVVVLSRLRLRTLHANLGWLSRKLAGTNLIIYEQDPWENFYLTSPYFNSYKLISEQLPIITFLNTSHWWSDRVNEMGIPSRFVQMWMLPKYCIEPTPWSRREKGAIFCGTLRPNRKLFLDDLAKRGLSVEVVPSIGYWNYLDMLSRVKLIIRSEMVEYQAQFLGENVILNQPHALWIRDIECASRGVFSMREAEGEGITWGINNIPTIIPFSTIDDAVTKAQRILTMSNEEADTLVNAAVDYVRTSEGWNTIPKVIKDIGRDRGWSFDDV